MGWLGSCGTLVGEGDRRDPLVLRPPEETTRSPTGKRVVSQPPLTPNVANEPGIISKLSLPQSEAYIILTIGFIRAYFLMGLFITHHMRQDVL
ncbi:hypothetical protein DXT76_21790 [Halobacillus trueperi]|uniref:Uncharacterized protein n=1 Tax=Halobacillus trueperi TaxID=156205 RepID=A0A3D8V8W0_9BACI|nr:hypothetical protein DXT76_21790 [Halobacillus trueperi]